MKLTSNQMNKLAAEVYKSLTGVENVDILAEQDEFTSLVLGVLKKNLEDEKNLDEEVNTMMDQLDKQNPGAFERYKMFPLLKKKLAAQKKFVL